MPSLTQQAHDWIRGVIQPGDLAIDATAGNGHDTCFLADCVGPNGRVYAFDIQSAAIEATAALIDRQGLRNITLLQCSHADMAEAIPESCQHRIAAVMFNLGYLPGGDKSIITRTETTRRALVAALELLRPDGLLTVIGYPGHPGGADELAAVESVIADVDEVFVDRFEGPPGKSLSPRLWVVRKCSCAG